jgi:hypothetical protein
LLSKLLPVSAGQFPAQYSAGIQLFLSEFFRAEFRL